MFIAVAGTFMLPVGWTLAGMNWWRFGQRGRAYSYPLASLLTWVVLQLVLPTLLGKLHSRGAALDIAVLFAENLGAMLVAISGLAPLVQEQRAAGGTSGNRWLPVVFVVAPTCLTISYLLLVLPR